MTDNIIRRSKTETRKAKLRAASELLKWREEEVAKIEALGLEGAELEAAMRAMTEEKEKRRKAGESRAKSQNTLTKLTEREIRDEKERDSATRPD